MPNRWTILAVLFAVRASIAVQFQSVGAVAPLLSRDLGVGLADIGILIGLYFAPGVALALPGGAIGQKFGDKATASAGLVLMLAGSLTMAFLPSWDAQIAGRLIAGTGGVVLNVLVSKMVADWFADREISTAMAIVVNSWPVGIAAALVLLPPIAAVYGLAGVHAIVAAVIVVGLALLLAVYESPAVAVGGASARARLDLGVVAAVIAAGCIWAFYNVGFAMVFSFGPTMLVERGWSITEAGSTISIVLWLSAISVPLGGLIADGTKRHNLILVMCCIVFATLLLLLTRDAPIAPAIVALGLVCGLAAGPIMRLPAIVLAPATRAFGMGLFFATYYVGMMIGPVIGGRYATWAGSAGAAFDFGAAVLLACPVILWVFQHLARATTRPALSST